MNDYQKALAAAREALDAASHVYISDPSACEPFNAVVESLSDLIAALDAQQPVAWAIDSELERVLRRKDGGHGGLCCLSPDKCRDDLVPLYAVPPAPAVPEGYALVPVEPTPEMVAAADSAFDDWWQGESPEPSFTAVYCAMLAAAQGGGP